MSGIFHKTPPQPKYAFIWDVETVLDFLRKLPKNDMFLDKLDSASLNVVSIIVYFKDIRSHTHLGVYYFTKHSSEITPLLPI